MQVYNVVPTYKCQTILFEGREFDVQSSRNRI